MSDAREVTATLLDERPDLEPALREILDCDAEGPWTFEDVDCDSGEFGELVSRPLVESAGEGYRLVDREATRTVLDGQTGDDDTGSEKTAPAAGDRQASERIGRRLAALGGSRPGGESGTLAGLLAVTLGVLVAVRSLSYDAVFRAEDVVLTSNDPHHYRYWVDQLLAESPGLFDLPAVAAVLGNRASGEPLTYVLGWWTTELVGHGTTGATVAVLPVVVALVLGLVVAWTAWAVSVDARIAVLSVFSLAIMPANVLYTHLGFFDHHGLDFLWFALLTAGLVWLARDRERRTADSEGLRAHLRSPRTWLVVAGFGVVCGASMLTWNGAPLLLLGVATYAAVALPDVVRGEGSPLLAAVPLVAGLALGTAVAGLVHVTAGWQELPVVLAPAIVAVGTAGVAVVSEVAARRDRPAHVALAGALGTGLVVVVLAGVLTPGILVRFGRRFVGDLLGRESIAETAGLFAPEASTSFGPFEQFGLLAVFVFAGLGYVTWQCLLRREPVWLVPTGLAWPFLVLAAIQRRFTGELSVLAGLFAAVGIVWLGSRVGLCRPLACFDGHEQVSVGLARGRLADRAFLARAAGMGVLVLVLVAASGVVFGAVFTDVPASDEQYETATWIRDDADGERAYVLSDWDTNRLYNYVVWGGGDGFGYAEQTHQQFLRSPDPDAWYGNVTDAERIDSGDGVASVEYVVVENARPPELLLDTAYGQLVQLGGTAVESTDGVAHFRYVYRSSGGAYYVFETVPGARLVGTAPPGEQVVVRTPIEPEGAEQFDYARVTEADENGTYAVRVAHPGEYRTDEGVVGTVTERDVETGTTVSARGSAAGE